MALVLSCVFPMVRVFVGSLIGIDVLERVLIQEVNDFLRVVGDCHIFFSSGSFLGVDRWCDFSRSFYWGLISAGVLFRVI